MAYWLVKTEPTAYSFEDLVKEGRTVWSGVKNAAARLNMRKMKVGDEVLVYHTGGEKAVVGVALVVKEAYVPKGETDEKAVVVELQAGKKLKRAVGMAEIRKDRQFKEWGLVKIGRLSVVPTSQGEFGAIVEMGGR
jgi:predicted RNA-binding protein with PUA-like domain